MQKSLIRKPVQYAKLTRSDLLIAWAIIIGSVAGQFAMFPPWEGM
jgi:hypothetical protein